MKTKNADSCHLSSLKYMKQSTNTLLYSESYFFLVAKILLVLYEAFSSHSQILGKTYWQQVIRLGSVASDQRRVVNGQW